MDMQEATVTAAEEMKNASNLCSEVQLKMSRAS